MAGDSDKIQEVARRLEEIEKEVADLNTEMSLTTAAISQGEPGIRWWLRLSLILFGAAVILALVSLIAAILAVPALATGAGAAIAAKVALVAKLLAILAFFLALIALLVAFLKTLTKGTPAAMLTTLTGLQTHALQLREELERRKVELEREKPH